MSDRHTIWQIADQIQMDLRAAQAKMTELRSHLASLNLVDEEKTMCPECGVPCKGPVTLSEHLYKSHDGPMPEHWVALEAKIAKEAEAA